MEAKVLSRSKQAKIEKEQKIWYDFNYLMSIGSSRMAVYEKIAKDLNTDRGVIIRTVKNFERVEAQQ